MRVAIASDHGGYRLKERLKKYLKNKDIDCIDCGTDSEDSCDYPDFAQKACGLVQAQTVNFAILICGTGIGMSIAANKMMGIRAALCGDEFSAHYTRAHNNANVLTLGARVIGEGLAENIVDIFLNSSFEGGRHATRVDMIMDVEKRNHNLQNTFLRYRHIMDMEEETADGGLFFQDKKRHAEVV